MNFADFGIDSSSLAGSLESKLAAARNAGFTQIMLSATDIVSHPTGPSAAIEAIVGSGLRITALTLRDFEGLPRHLHSYKLDIAKAMLALCHDVGARTLLVEATVSSHAVEDEDAVVRDLRKLGMLAIPLGVSIAFKGLPWSRTVDGYMSASNITDEVGYPNVGIAIDALQFFGTQASTLEDIDGLVPDGIMLVQLSDCMWHKLRSTEEQLATSTHFRVFPGEGVHGDEVRDLMTRLQSIGYYRDYSLAVYNDDYRQLPARFVAERARRSAVWLGETVLRRSLPVPNVERLRALKA